MDIDAVRHRLDIERRTLVRDGEVLQMLPSVTRIASTRGQWHVISSSVLTAENADSVIDEQVAHYRDLKAEVEWKVYGHDGPADLRQRLARRGFAIGPCEMVVVLDLGRPPEWIDEPSLHPVQRVSTAEQIGLFRGAAEEIFGKDHQRTADEVANAARAGSTQHIAYIAVEGNAAVSVGRLYTHPLSVFGGLYGGGTREAYRHRGLYRSMVAARARDAAKMGARYLLVDALPTSRPILERLGFVRLTETWPCTWRP